MGLFLNDLNPHGLSREMVFSGFSHYSRLDLMCEREENRAEELETSLVLADSWKKQGDELLYSMIPRTVADKIRSGQDPMATCQTFEEVTVIFAEIQEDSGAETNQIQSAMNTVSTLNAAFSAFDALIQSPYAYKVETVGKVYMAVSGAPDENPLHIQHAADLSLLMLESIKNLHIEGVTVKIGKVRFNPLNENLQSFLPLAPRFPFRFGCCRYCRSESSPLLSFRRFSQHSKPHGKQWRVEQNSSLGPYGEEVEEVGIQSHFPRTRHCQGKV